MSQWMWEARIELAQRAYGRHIGCAAGHVSHAHRRVDADNFPAGLLVFNAEGYADTPGYCPGDDDVSRTIIRTGRWEPRETAVFRKAVARDPGDVIDFGTQIGWYTVQAALLGRRVLAIEALEEHQAMTYGNAVANGVHENLFQVLMWVDHYSPRIIAQPPVAEISIVKIDLEGNDVYAVNMLHGLFKEGCIANVLCEISPVFNYTYPELIRTMTDIYGFKAAIVNPWEPFEHCDVGRIMSLVQEIKDGPGQVDMIFTRHDLEDFAP